MEYAGYPYGVPITNDGGTLEMIYSKFARKKKTLHPPARKRSNWGRGGKHSQKGPYLIMLIEIELQCSGVIFRFA
jgi:hypothetical protein